MYAVIAHSGQQFRLEEGQVLILDRINAEAGSSIDIDDVLLIGGDKVKVGNPTVKGAKVTLEVLGNELGDKRIRHVVVRGRLQRLHHLAHLERKVAQGRMLEAVRDGGTARTLA